jgi:amino acid transporter
MAEPGTYKRSLGLFELVSLGVGGTIGSGIFVVPGIVAKILGPASLIAWLIVAVSASTVLLSLAYVSNKFTSSGSFYTLFSTTFGRKVAFPIILLYLISSVFGVSTIAAGIGQYISYFGPSSLLPIEIFIIAFFCLINIIGISLSGMTEIILTTLKTIPLILLSLILLPFIRPENLVQATPLTASGLLATIIIVYWPFTGFEISAIPVGETKDLAHIKKSLILVMLIVVGIYLILNIALIGSVGASVLSESPAPLAAAANLVVTNSGPFIVFIGIIAMLSALNAYIIGTSRIMQNIASCHSVLLIQDLSGLGTPAHALILGCGISGALLFFSNHFEQLATISVITTLIPYIFFCLAAFILVTDIKSRIIAMVGSISTAAILIIYFVI